ncbi:hypothetical protein D8674_001977 [Pyrus ussuriensis x Pyrus communis]|uniref:Uncharacterized protein n=1 Tax=Pyrus ussuriensis x Pyrus communis TaxID=2448454 RepID=A0A5N5FIE6_9ROSA|nr:hypothetical protein D8674_001977 [Pyrus ussuriensis x Pyrus communis]
MQYKAGSATETSFPQTNPMAAATAPIAIGTRGTVGSLVLKEIEYFSKIELDRRGSSSSMKPLGQILGLTSGGSGSHCGKSGFRLLLMAWRRRKRRGGSGSGSGRGFLASMCFAAEVAETNRRNGVPGFSYKILKDDMNNLSI